MKGDFSTQRFNAGKHYNRVLKQQGRVDLDSDWNEQASIAQHHERSLILDLVGPAAGPLQNCGFGLGDAKLDGVTAAAGDFILQAGRYYVNGLMVENNKAVSYLSQPSLPTPDKLAVGKSYVAYLDVWERHITYIEDDSIREVALGGPDTTTRVKTVWQVRVLDSPQAATDANGKLLVSNAAAGVPAGATAPAPSPAAPPAVSECDAPLQPLLTWKSGTMTARLQPSDPSDTPCILPPESRYRGLENHLYRVEIHTAGDTTDPNEVPTFKWSRENGSVVTRWLATTGGTVQVANARGFSAGQWVEFTTESDDLMGQPGPLALITQIDGDVLTVDGPPALAKNAALPKVRAWDQTSSDTLTLTNGAIAIAPGQQGQLWIPLEDGIEVGFSAGQYRSGDYWLITARVATGAIDWPADGKGNPLALPPEGIAHYYAPLFVFDAEDKAPYVSLGKDCRCRFAPLACMAVQRTPVDAKP